MSTGARRVLSVTLRPATAEDCRWIWLWRNDPETRRASFDSSPIPFETHEAWFRATLEGKDRRLYVILADSMETGVVRLDVSGREAEVSIHLAPESRFRGVGSAAIQGMVDLAFGPLGLERLVARTKLDNQASVAAFERAGFTREEARTVVTLVKSRAGA